MGTFTIPIGNHLFTPDQLQKVLTETIPKVPPGHSSAVAAAVDASGAKVGLIIGSSDGHWQAKAALEHDWGGDNKVAGSVLYSW